MSLDAPRLAREQPSALARLAGAAPGVAAVSRQTQFLTMKRVAGIGGIFLRSGDPPRLREWYRKHLGIEFEEWGGLAFRWEGPGTTVWNIFEASSNYFDPSTSPVMVNYRVADLRALVAALRAEGCNVMDKVDESEYGKFGWVVDPDGNKIELWEPPAGQ